MKNWNDLKNNWLVAGASFCSRCLTIDRLIKSAAVAASSPTKMQVSACVPVVRAVPLASDLVHFGDSQTSFGSSYPITC